MEFTQKDELGLKRTYYVVTEIDYDQETYVIYSDLLKDNEDEFRLLVGKIENNKVNRVDKVLEDAVKAYFKFTERDYVDYIKELL
jgi:hypothetical protein